MKGNRGNGWCDGNNLVSIPGICGGKESMSYRYRFTPEISIFHGKRTWFPVNHWSTIESFWHWFTTEDLTKNPKDGKFQEVYALKTVNPCKFSTSLGKSHTGKAMGKAHRCCVWAKSRCRVSHGAGMALPASSRPKVRCLTMPGAPGAPEIFTIKPWANGRNFHRFSHEISCVFEVRRIWQQSMDWGKDGASPFESTVDLQANMTWRKDGIYWDFSL